MNALDMVYSAIDAVNEDNPDAPQIAKEPDAPLLQGESGIDSLALVNLVVAIEEVVHERTGRSVSVADESVFSAEETPFATVGTLAAHLERLLGQAA